MGRRRPLQCRAARSRRPVAGARRRPVDGRRRPLQLPGRSLAVVPGQPGRSRAPTTSADAGAPSPPSAVMRPDRLERRGLPHVITVQTATGGPRQVPTKWAGQWLAVHRPVRRDGLSTAPALWTLTLRPLGLSMGAGRAPAGRGRLSPACGTPPPPGGMT